MADPKTQEAVTLMLNFAQRTGLTGERPAQRHVPRHYREVDDTGDRRDEDPFF